MCTFPLFLHSKSADRILPIRSEIFFRSDRSNLLRFRENSVLKPWKLLADVSRRLLTSLVFGVSKNLFWYFRAQFQLASELGFEKKKSTSPNTNAAGLFITVYLLYSLYSLYVHGVSRWASCRVVSNSF